MNVMDENGLGEKQSEEIDNMVLEGKKKKKVLLMHELRSAGNCSVGYRSLKGSANGSNRIQERELGIPNMTFCKEEGLIMDKQ